MTRLPSLSFSVRETGKACSNTDWPSVICFPRVTKGHPEFSIKKGLAKPARVVVFTIDVSQLMRAGERVIH
ncbi:hypothetical protein JKP28_01050 [Vibrio vulnificus]|uniref:Uncharacterized protein n=1 Tax=Vibrio vulnificus (strain CMCP6) TaxID=216895 RepID=A0A3Q0KZQ6_VIBVU|nr:hypothetical protein [Vibrio vulnificus]EWS69977.1 hypothetical protein Y702_05935 [Vibrio vulnificus BAA87]AAO08034.1 hypothetical protein VV2_1133 [Vibrio vulnificus CMCP6]ARN69012.1 hypothetical protein FORC36_4495 [Vibrio vulnificus]EGQ9830910.1 hypothetical protein [Vibrio vulnificus]EGR0109753.1 hypothetical protein [Vibrio vulnificus]